VNYRDRLFLSMVYRLTNAIEKPANLFKGLAGMAYHQSERRDSNPRPPLPQSGALPSCATPRSELLFYSKTLK
jgi:hypothetical protein